PEQGTPAGVVLPFLQKGSTSCRSTRGRYGARLVPLSNHLDGGSPSRPGGYSNRSVVCQRTGPTQAMYAEEATLLRPRKACHSHRIEERFLHFQTPFCLDVSVTTRTVSVPDCSKKCQPS